MRRLTIFLLGSVVNGPSTPQTVYPSQGRKGYLKIHIAVDIKKKRILSLEVTRSEVYEGKTLYTTCLSQQIVIEPFFLKALFGFIVVAAVASQKGCVMRGHIAKMIRDAITVCDKNRDSATSYQLQDILDKTEHRKGSFMK